MNSQPEASGGPNQEKDSSDLTSFGYTPLLDRAMGPFGSFAVAFSMVSIVTAIFFLFPIVFTETGGVGIWLWVPVFLGVFPIVLVYAHVGARIPLTGYAYQWNSRLVNRHFGWFSGWTAMLAFFGGTASIGAALANVFGGVLWTHPTQAQIVMFAGIAVGAAGLITLVSVRVTALVNNLGVSFELASSVLASGILIAGTLLYFDQAEGFSVLGQVNETTGRALSISAIMATALLPISTFLGWEGAADMAEETKDPRRVTPAAMIRANLVSVATSFFMIIAFAVAIPHGVADMLLQTENPLFYIFSEQLGNTARHLLEVAVFIAIFSCLLANMAVATRMCYSLARDRMLPGSAVLSTVSTRTQTPVAAVCLVTLVAFGINLLSQGLVNNIVSIVVVSYYATYLVTNIAVLYAIRSQNMPDGISGGYDLGRWLVPLASFGALWSSLIVGYNLLGHDSYIALQYFAGAQILGLVWYLLYLRRRIRSGDAGAASVREEAEGERRIDHLTEP